MKKYYLKKSYIRDEINIFFTNIILFFLRKKFQNRQKILVKMTDGLGDIVIRSKLIEKIVEEYGQENTLFVIKKEYEFLGKVLNINVIPFTKKDKYNLFRRIKRMYEINLLGIKKFINIEWSNDDFIRNIYSDEKIAIEALEREDYKNNVACTQEIKLRKEKKFNNEKKNVIELLAELGNNILSNKITSKDIIPNLKEKFFISKQNEGIAISVGATDKNRVCSPYKMIEFIKVLLERYPDEKIYLIGNGERQEKYSQKILELLYGNKKIVDLVGKTSIEEVLEIVAKAKLFIGFDSGLYNFRYTLRKKQIALFQSKQVPYFHEDDSLVVLESEEVKNKNFVDVDYPNEKMNAISSEKFIEALIQLELKEK